MGCGGQLPLAGKGCGGQFPYLWLAGAIRPQGSGLRAVLAGGAGQLGVRGPHSLDVCPSRTCCSLLPTAGRALLPTTHPQLLQADTFDLHSFHTLTGTTFMLLAEPQTPDAVELLRTT